MSGIPDIARTATASLDGATLVSVAVFGFVFVAVFVAGFQWLSPSKGAHSKGRGANKAAGVALLNGEPLSGSRATSPEIRNAPAAPRTTSRTDARRVMGVVHKTLSLLIVGFLLAATIGSYLVASPHDGTLLIPAVLAFVTLITAGHLHSQARRFEPVGTELQAGLLRNFESDFASKLQAAMRGNVEVRWASSPEVHRIDEEAVARARTMQAEGRSIDEICRSMDADYDQWSAPHQQAYQGLIRAALEHS